MKKLLATILSLLILACQTNPRQSPKSSSYVLSAINDAQIPIPKHTIAITHVRIIDGNGGAPIENGFVIVKDNIIVDVGEMGSLNIPDEAETIDGTGMSLLPGLIDAHFHLNDHAGHPNLFLRNGITSVRDPGAWIEDFEQELAADYPNPRLFLTGPHLDMFPPAYPENSYILRDRLEARNAVNTFVDQGASAIKVYFRLSTGLIEEVCKTAHERGIPVTAHLEITDAREAIQAGLDGIEHITSFGTSLMRRDHAEQYRQAVLADNNARRQGRYEVWSNIDLDNEQTDELIDFLLEKKTWVCPTLGAFEYRLSESKKDTIRQLGYEKMMAFTRKAIDKGVRIVVGSHSAVPYAEWGWAYHHEMELLAACGMPPSDIIVASTMENARFFRIDEKLGSIERGKIADLLLIEGNPLKDISIIQRIHKIMINGNWID